jgi:hypothetical protein
MTLKRLEQLVIGGAVVAALALGAPAVAGAATGMNGSSAPTVTLQAGKGEQTPTAAADHARNGSTPALHLSDHEQYVRHHQRLA